MEWYFDSLACLAVSKRLISEIEDMVDKTIRDEALVPFMKVKIKNSLENCRSPLDYAAQYVFAEYCKSKYLEKEQKKPIKKRNLKPNIYYPIRRTSDSFESVIKQHYFPLKSTNPEIITIFEKGQLFSDNENPFLNYLNELTNENKHRSLTTHIRNTTAHIKSGQIGSITLENVVIKNCNSAIQYDDVNIDFINPSPYDHLFDAEVSVEYFFKELKLSVIPTLNNIYQGVAITIEDLYKECNKNNF